MRYFFQTADGKCYPDHDGTELGGLREACLEASKVLGDFLKNKPKSVWESDALTLDVLDDKGLVLFTLNLSVAMSPAVGRHPAI